MATILGSVRKIDRSVGYITPETRFFGKKRIESMFLPGDIREIIERTIEGGDRCVN